MGVILYIVGFFKDLILLYGVKEKMDSYILAIVGNQSLTKWAGLFKWTIKYMIFPGVKRVFVSE